MLTAGQGSKYGLVKQRMLEYRGSSRNDPLVDAELQSTTPHTPLKLHCFGDKVFWQYSDSGSSETGNNLIDLSTKTVFTGRFSREVSL